MWIVLALIMIVPWFVAPGSPNPYHEAKELLLVGGCWALVLWSLLKSPLPISPPRNPWTIWLSLFLAGIGVAHFQWPYLHRSLDARTVTYNVYTWLPTVNLLLACLAAHLLSTSVLRPPLTTQRMTQWWCLSAALSAGYALLQTVGLDQWYVPTATGHLWGRVTGSFGNPEALALYLGMLLPLCLPFKSKRYVAFFALMVVAMWCTRCKGAWLIGAIGVSAYLVAWRWYAAPDRVARTVLILLGACAIGAGVVSVIHLAAGDQRHTFWSWAWQLLQDQTGSTFRRVPSFTGYGLGAFTLLMQKRQLLWAHNEWLQALVELGVIGTGLLMAAVGWAYREAWRKSRWSLLDAAWFGVLSAWLASTVVFPTAHWPHTAFIGLCAFGVSQREELAHGG